MRLQGFARFLELVTPERLEEYLREKEWTLSLEAPGRYRIWNNHPQGAEIEAGFARVLVSVDQRFVDYGVRIEQALCALADFEERNGLAVLYDLLPPEHRGELVKAVFPGLEAMRTEYAAMGTTWLYDSRVGFESWRKSGQATGVIPQGISEETIRLYGAFLAGTCFAIFKLEGRDLDFSEGADAASRTPEILAAAPPIARGESRKP